MGEERRITDLTKISAFRANDYIAVDNASEAQTKKLPASAITGAISAAQTDATRALNIARSTSSFPTGDAYSSSSAYKVGDMVIYNNTLYRCKTACSAASWSVNANNFEATSLASALTDVNNDLSEVTPIIWRWGIPSVFVDQGSKVVQIGKYLFVKLVFTTNPGIGTNYKNLGALYVNLGENTRLVNNQTTILNSDQALNIATFKNSTNYIEAATSSAMVGNKWYELATILELNI